MENFLAFAKTQLFDRQIFVVANRKTFLVSKKFCCTGTDNKNLFTHSKHNISSSPEKPCKTDRQTHLQQQRQKIMRHRCFSPKNNGGTSSEGRKLRVFKSFMSRSEKPVESISTPPTMDISLVTSCEITP